MDIKQIQDLIKFVAKSGVNEVSIEEPEFKITIKTSKEATVVNTTIPSPVSASPVEPLATDQPVVEAKPATDDTSKFITIKSPMISTIYRSPTTDKPLEYDQQIFLVDPS